MNNVLFIARIIRKKKSYISNGKVCLPEIGGNLPMPKHGALRLYNFFFIILMILAILKMRVFCFIRRFVRRPTKRRGGKGNRGKR